MHHKAITAKHTPSRWLLVWATIYLVITILGLIAPKSDLLIIIRLSGILLCFIYVVLYSPKDHLLLFAMFTTCLADLTLAASNTSAVGVTIFLVAQLTHLIRLDGKRLRLPLSIFITTIITIIGLDLWLQFIPLILIVSTFYFATILMNLIVSWRWHRHEPNSRPALLSMLGFTLFMCCDICVGVSYLSLTAIFPTFLYIPANFFAWFFYYPSQVLISNSSTFQQPSIKSHS